MRMSLKTSVLAAVLGLSALSAACGDDDDTPAPIVEGEGGEGAGSGNGGAPPSSSAGEPPAQAGGGGEAEPVPTDFTERLERLGADTGLDRDPVDRAGKKLPTGYHPLKKPFATLGGRDEIYFAGSRFGGQREGILDDGFEGAFAQLLEPQFTAWHDLAFRAAVAADVNGDGIQEFVVIYYDPARKEMMGKVAWGPEGKRSAQDDEPFTLTAITTPADIFTDYFQYALTAANLDDDPADELVVGFTDLWVFDDLEHDWAELLHEPLASRVVSVCKGDFDGALADPHDEVMVLWNPGDVQHYQVFDGLEPSFGAGGRVLRPTLNNPEKTEAAFRQGFCVAAEVDGRDAAQEIAILSGDIDRWRLMIMDDAGTNYRTFNSFRNTLHEGENSLLTAADIDGDGIDEIVAQEYLFDGLEKLPSSSDTTEVTNDKLEVPEGVTKKPHGLGNSYQMRSGRVAPDYGYPPLPNVEQFVALDRAGRLVYYARNPTMNNQYTWVVLGQADNGVRGSDIIAIGNVDFDSPVVRYTGDHELLYSSPELLVALAAPPFYAGTNQADASSTSFGRGTSQSIDEEKSIGFSVGFSVGYESSDPLGIASSSFSVSVSAAFDSLASSGSTVEEFVTYTGGAEDSVVFTVVPFDVYYYEVISAPDATQVGNTLSINLPRAPQTLLASSAYFDQFVDESRKSAPLFGTHRVGEPRSYSSLEQRDALCGGKCFKASKALAIGQGTGSTTVEISKSERKGTGASYSLSTEIESEASLGGVTVGSSVGFSYGFSMTTTTEESTVFTGELGSLEDLTPDKSYSAGLFAHQHLHPTSTKPVLIVDYWVE